ncbi:MAG TPA: Holliday junction branch migration protein RuvA [Candidatus Merdivicinus intestinigallinarum]|nr:Holliday junction branch migration protein RuvA [Candidatus Merdivicinus intestinigallinarum]
MIYSVRGRLAAVEPNLAVVECAGVGYAVRTSSVTVSRLPAIGEEAMLYTYLHISENAAELFGFRDQNELSCFKMLISVTRVGPKAALSVLSSVTPERFALCVASGDAKTISKAPGIGLKTAQRIILELKDKMSKEAAASGFSDAALPVVEDSSNAGEAIAALVVLGYAQSEAAAVITRLDPAMSVEDMIKAGLRALAIQ